MREIKFRAWNQDNQEFEYFVFAEGGHYTHTKLEAYSTNAIKVWRQFTSLKDKNGVEIYEGDIVTAVDSRYNELQKPERYRGVVVFEECSYRVKQAMGSTPQLGHWLDVEVIGNTYENPELLEES